MKDFQIYIIRQFSALREFVFRKSDPVLLLFLLLITNYRFSLKIFALTAIYIYRPNFKFKHSGLLIFYSGMIVLGLFNLFVISGDLSGAHIATVLTACSLWASCFLTFHQLQLFVERNSSDQIINSLKLLTVINFVFSIADLIRVMMATHTLNPYNQISPPPYGISSGDLIGGVYGEMHLVNMTISAFTLFFFLYRKNFSYSFLAVIPLLLTGSNLGTLLTVLTLVFMLFVKRSLIIKYFVMFMLAIVVIFYIKITPDNLSYFQKSFGKMLSHLTNKPVRSDSNGIASNIVVRTPAEIKNMKIHDYLMVKNKDYLKMNMDNVYFLKEQQRKLEKKQKQKWNDYTYYLKDSLQKAKKRDKRFNFGNLKKFDLDHRSGKAISVDQLSKYMSSDWRRLLFGSGPGGFSSRLAFITSGVVNDSRILMALPHYENPAFTENHKAIFRYLMYLDDEHHSITNLPFSWYNELLGEYGLAGALVFLLFYVGFFIRRFNLLLAGRLLLALMMAFFLFDYWYQRLSVMIIFELIMLLDMKMKIENYTDSTDEN